MNTHRTELIAQAGVLISLLLALLTWILTRERAQALQAAHKMNKELIRSEARARLAINASNLAIWDYDLTTGHVELSEGWAQLLEGEQKPTFTTMTALTALVPVEDQPMVTAAITRALKGHNASSYHAIHRVKKADGSFIWVLSEGHVTERDTSGRALRMLRTNRDITEHKMAEAELINLTVSQI